MSNELADVDERATLSELLSNKGVAKIIYLGSFNSTNTEVSVQIRTDVSDQERITCFGDENRGVDALGSYS